jgi:hypothetical protein
MYDKGPARGKKTIPDPPPLDKRRSSGGVQNPIRSVDIRALFLVADLSASFITHSGPPPPPLKAERTGGSEIQYGSLI